MEAIPLLLVYCFCIKFLNRNTLIFVVSAKYWVNLRLSPEFDPFPDKIGGLDGE